MDPSRFTDSKTGQLKPIRTEMGPDWSFIPDPLPSSCVFDPELWPLLLRARQELTKLDVMGQNLVANPSLLLDPLAKRDALRSSSMEGTYATAEELLLYEASSLKSKDAHTATLEVMNYDSALRYGTFELKRERGLPLSHALIKELHRRLLQDVKNDYSNAGAWRDKHVFVGSGRKYIPPPPGDPLIQCLNDLERFMHSFQRETKFDALLVSYMVHYQFEAIHPFRDGNGRVGRLLLALTTFEWTGLHLPWLYMSAFFERHKDEYVDNMFRISTHGDWNKWFKFCLEGTIEQCRDAIRRISELKDVGDRMREKVGKLPRMAEIINQLFLYPVFTIGQVRQWGSASKQTAKRDIDILVDNGFVAYLHGDKPKMYYAPEIFRAAYDEFSNEMQVLEGPELSDEQPDLEFEE